MYLSNKIRAFILHMEDESRSFLFIDLGSEGYF